MKDKAQNPLDENQIWTIVMVVLPAILLMNLGKEFSDGEEMNILFAGLFGGIGGFIGFAANHFTKDKKRVVKVFATILLIVISGLAIYFIS